MQEPTEGKSLVTEGSIYMTLDNAANATLGGIFWIVVAKIAASEVVGRAAIVVAVTSILVVFAGLGFAVGASKFISEYNSKGLPALSRLAYSKTIQITVVTSVVIAVGLALAGAYPANELTLLLVVGALSIPFQALVRSLNGVYQGCHRMAFCLIGDTTFLVLRLVIAVLLVLEGLGALGIVLAYAAGFATSAVVGLSYLAPTALPKGEPGESKDLVRSMFRFSAPNYVATICNTGVNQASVPLVGIFLGASAAAYYNIASLARLVLVTMAMSIGLALLPTVSSIASKASRETIGGLYNASVRSAMLLVAGPILILCLIPDRVLELISREYSSAAIPLQILAISSLGSVIFGVATSALNGLNRPSSAFLATGTGAAVGIAATAIMIPLWGLPGAAAGSLVNGVLSASISVVLLSRREGVRTVPGSVFKPLLSLGSSFALGELAILLGIHIYVSVAFSLVTLLGVSLILKVITLSELGAILKLVLRKIGTDRPLRLVGGRTRKRHDGNGKSPQ